MMRRVLLRHPYVVLLVLSGLAFLPFLGRRDIVTSHEARVVQVAREMAASGWPWNAELVEVPAVEVVKVHGRTETRAREDGSTWRVNPWLIPVINGQVRLQKPPLPYWTVAVLFRLFGTVDQISEGLARLPCAVMGVACTMVMYDLGRRLQGRLAGWCAALVWISSYFVPDEFRKVMADPYLAMFTLMTVWAWVRSTLGGKRIRWLWVFYVALGLGGLAKGPVIVLHVGIALVAFWLTHRRKVSGPWWAHAVGVILIAAITAPWLIAVLGRIENAWQIFRYESVGEFADNVEKARGWFYYFPQLLQISLPWTPVLIVGIVLALRRRGRDARGMFPLIWYAATVLVFSFSNVKKNAYLLPMMPAQTLLISHGLMFLLAWGRRERAQWARRPRGLLLGMCAGFVIAASVLFNIYVTGQENQRSARPVAKEIAPMLAEPGTTMRTDLLPEEASVYLPLVRFDRDAIRQLVILDRRNLPPNALLREVRLASTSAPGARWKVYEFPPRW